MFPVRSHGVMVSTLDSESSDPSSNLGGTSQSRNFFLLILNTSLYLYRYFSYTIEKTSNHSDKKKLQVSLKYSCIAVHNY